MCLDFYYIWCKKKKKTSKRQILSSGTSSSSWPMLQYHEWCANHRLGTSDWNAMLEKCSIRAQGTYVTIKTTLIVIMVVFQLSSDRSPATLTQDLDLMAGCCTVAGPFQGTSLLKFLMNPVCTVSDTEVMLNRNHLLLAHLGFYYPQVYFKYSKFKKIIDRLVMSTG